MRGRRTLQRFEEALRKHVEPVVATVDLDWHSAYKDSSSGTMKALFEADARVFLERLPLLWSDWTAEEADGCIDLWIAYRPEAARITARLEFEDIARWLKQHGHADIAARLERAEDLEAGAATLAEGLALLIEAGRRN